MKTDPVPLERAKRMRREPTVAEAVLWRHLRGGQIAGVRFSRQVPIGAYIADFVARSAKLVIEVDGDTHTESSRDAGRTMWLEERGYRVVRFSNLDAMTNLSGVLETIASALTTAPLPTLSPAGRGHSAALA